MNANEHEERLLEFGLRPYFDDNRVIPLLEEASQLVAIFTVTVK